MTRTFLLAFIASSFVFAGCAEPPPAPPATDAIEAEPLVVQRILEATEAVNADPTSAEAWGRLGEIYDIHRLGVQALACYEQASKIDPDQWLWPYFSGIVTRDNDQAAAVAYFERAIELNPDHAPTHLYIGAAYLLLEDLDRSEEHFTRAMELDQASINARIGLGRVALARGEAETAVTILEEAVRLAPREAASHHNLAQIYRSLGRYEDADREERIAKYSPVPMQPGDMASFVDPARDEVTLREGRSSMWLLENSRRMMAAGQEAQAFELLETALAADPGSEIALLGTARILFNRGDLSQARQRVERALELDERSAAAHVELGNLLARSGDIEGAMREFETAIEIDPETAEAQNNLAALLFEGGRTEEGLARLREAARALPGETNIQFNLAVALQRQNENDEAIEVLRSILDIRPTQVPAMHMLGYILASRDSTTRRSACSPASYNCNRATSPRGWTWAVRPGNSDAMRRRSPPTTKRAASPRTTSRPVGNWPGRYRRARRTTCATAVTRWRWRGCLPSRPSTVTHVSSTCWPPPRPRRATTPGPPRRPAGRS